MASRQHRVPKHQAEAYRKLLGLLPVTRAHYGDPQPDGQNPFFIAEYKARARAPFVIRQAFEQLDAYASSQDSRTPIVLFHRIGQCHELDWVVLRVRDFREILRQQGLFTPQP